MPHEADRPIDLRALALALCVGAVAAAGSLLIVGLLHPGPSLGILSPIVFAMYFVADIVVALLFGLPALFVLRSLGAVNRWSTLMLGAVLGAAVGWLSPDGSGQVNQVGLWCFAGVLSSQASWLAWKRSARAHAA